MEKDLLVKSIKSIKLRMNRSAANANDAIEWLIENKKIHITQKGVVVGEEPIKDSDFGHYSYEQIKWPSLDNIGHEISSEYSYVSNAIDFDKSTSDGVTEVQMLVEREFHEFDYVPTAQAVFKALKNLARTKTETDEKLFGSDYEATEQLAKFKNVLSRP